MRQPTPVIPSAGNQIAPEVWQSFFGYSVPPVWVSENTAGGLPAIGRGVDMVANSVATMMVSADVLTGSGPAVAPHVVTAPNVLMGSHEFWSMVVRSLVVRGNFIGILVDFDDLGYAQQVMPVHPDSVSMSLATGLPVYTIDGHQYRWDEVIHLRANAPVGALWGMGVVERYRASLEGAIAAQQYGTNGFMTGGTPTIHVAVKTGDQELPQDVVDDIQTSFIERHGSGQRKPLVTPDGMSVNTISFKPQDMEFIESRKLSIAECALIVGLDPSDLSASVGNASLTYANITQRALARVSDSYGPWLRIIEEGWSRILPGGQFVRGNVESLFRTDTQGRYELHKLALESGFMTVDEVRAIEGLAPLPKDDPAPVDPAPVDEVAS